MCNYKQYYCFGLVVKGFHDLDIPIQLNGFLWYFLRSYMGSNFKFIAIFTFLYYYQYQMLRNFGQGKDCIL